MARAGALARVAFLTLLDLRHLGRERVIGSYLLETSDGPALFDCGPATASRELEARLAERGLALRDIRHLLLSHIHLDHAGAAGVLVREHPQLHGARLRDRRAAPGRPERLERSARRLYGDEFDTLWGALAPVPEENIRVAGTGCSSSTASPRPVTPRTTSATSTGRHALAGDAAGVRIVPARS